MVRSPRMQEKRLQVTDERAPSKSDIFDAGLGGKTITFKCWVGGSVRVPTL